MKRNILTGETNGSEKCLSPSCFTCPNCKAKKQGDEGSEPKANLLQLYAKEVENYSFYYSLFTEANQKFDR